MTRNPRLFSFLGGIKGAWRVTEQSIVQGDPLGFVTHVDVVAGYGSGDLPSHTWTLQGVTSNERYVTADEKAALLPVQPDLGRPDARCAVMIPLRKNDEWWSLSQDQRRQIFHRSGHNQKGMKALPAIARRLHHCRDLATSQSFDFVTWFEFAAQDTGVFDDLMAELRETEEWQYIDREYELRLVQAN
ncbi:MAG: chlorite dismutase family protein [Rubripirellula sp.]